jgi:hypothetical protein
MTVRSAGAVTNITGIMGTNFGDRPGQTPKCAIGSDSALPDIRFSNAPLTVVLNWQRMLEK